MSKGKFGNIYCTKCGARASTKCFICRSVFPEHQAETLYSSLINIGQVAVIGSDGKPGRLRDITVTIDLPWDTEAKPKRTIEEYVLGLFKEIVDCKNPLEVFCEHKWEWDEGKESSIGCGHGRKQRQQGEQKEAQPASEEPQ